MKNLLIFFSIFLCLSPVIGFLVSLLTTGPVGVATMVLVGIVSATGGMIQLIKY